jgi:hypothetical protein
MAASTGATVSLRARPGGERRETLLLTLAVLGSLAAAHAGELFARQPLWDERVYLAAFEHVLTGVSAYVDPVFLYPPSFAFAGAGLFSVLGEAGTIVFLRLANLLGLTLAIVIAALRLPSGLAVRLVAAMGVAALSPAVSVALGYGNISPFVVGITLTAASLAIRAPVRAGLLLGLAVVLKPLGAALLPLMLFAHWAPEERSALRRAAWVALATAAIASLPTLAELRPYLERSATLRSQGGSLSLFEILRTLRSPVPAWLLFAAVVAASLLVLRRPRTRPDFLVVASVAAPLSLPLVWSHTLLLTLPAQAAAIAAVTRRWQAAARPGPEAMITALGCIAIHTAYAIGGGSTGFPPALRALALLVPTLAPTALAITAHRGRAAPSESRESPPNSERVRTAD